MNIVPDITKANSVSSVEIEQVQQEEKEYILLGTFLRTKGLNLFYYNPVDGSVTEAVIKYGDTIHIYKMPDNSFIAIDWEAQKTTVDSKCIYFECLNMSNALQRVKRFKNGSVKELFNLRRPNPDGIKFF
jgi:GDP-D-mannose dehydratase